MKLHIHSALALLMLAAASGCETFQNPGECYDLQTVYVNDGALNATKAMVLHSGDSMAASIHDK